MSSQHRISFLKSPGVSEYTTSQSRLERDSKRPIVWALDPVSRDLRLIKPLLKAIDLWRSRRATSVIPVSILSPYELNWPVELIAPLEDRLHSIVDRSVVPFLKKMRVENCQDARVLLQQASSHRRAAKTLLDFAQSEGAQLVAVNTHAAKGLRRLGSFAELLIALSPVPVLAVNPTTRVPRSISKILFPSDLSDASRVVFFSVLKLAKDFGARIFLFHRLEIPYRTYNSDFGFGINPMLVDQAWRNAASAQKSRCEKWARDAEKHGVECETVFSESAEKVGSLINRISRSKHVDLIAMATYRGPIAQALIGGTARDVLTNASRPVVIFHGMKEGPSQKGKPKKRKTES